MARCNLGDGKSVNFWTDLWGDQCLHHRLPHLLSFVKNTRSTVPDVANVEFLEDLFHLPLSQEAHSEFVAFEEICNSAVMTIAQGNLDSWCYIWGSQNFLCSKAYKVLCGHPPTPPHFAWTWKSSCRSHHKFFFWLLLLDRLNTRNLLGRKNFQIPSYLCEICQGNHEETLVHLFWNYSFSQECWDFICPTRERNLSVLEAFADVKAKLKVPFSSEIIILAAWSIWMMRNNKIFNNQIPSFRNWKGFFIQELRMVAHRMKKKHVQSFKEWLQSQV
jgi:hypothetical protein